MTSTDPTCHPPAPPRGHLGQPRTKHQRSQCRPHRRARCLHLDDRWVPVVEQRCQCLGTVCGDDSWTRLDASAALGDSVDGPQVPDSRPSPLSTQDVSGDAAHQHGYSAEYTYLEQLRAGLDNLVSIRLTILSDRPADV